VTRRFELGGRTERGVKLLNIRGYRLEGIIHAVRLEELMGALSQQQAIRIIAPGLPQCAVNSVAHFA
jgi:hypothetical protein